MAHLNATALIAMPLADGGIGDLIELLIILTIIAMSAIGQAVQKMGRKKRETRRVMEAELASARQHADSAAPPAAHSTAPRRSKAGMTGRPAGPQQATSRTRQPAQVRESRRPAERPKPIAQHPHAPPPSARPISTSGQRRGMPPRPPATASPTSAEGESSVSPQDRTTRRISKIEHRHLQVPSPHPLGQLEQLAQRSKDRGGKDDSSAMVADESLTKARDILGGIPRHSQDWRRAIILAEILGPPLSVRGDSFMG